MQAETKAQAHRNVTVVVIVSMLFLLAGEAAPAPEAADPWSGMRFLLGEWTTGGDVPGEPSGSCSFALDLDGKILVRKNRAVYAAKPGEKAGTTHDDLLIVHSAPGGLVATYFDNEGHVIEYQVSTSDAGVTFESPEKTPGPRYRLVYEKKDGSTIAGAFSIAPPGKSFRTYLSWTAHRR